MSDFSYGGQAVMEGVMMRGEREWAVCVRAPSSQLLIHREPLRGVFYRSRWAKLPFLRGLAMLYDALGLGMRALVWSADVAVSEEGDEVHFSGPMAWGTVAFSLALGVALFVLLPTFLVGLVDDLLRSAVLSNLLEGLVRLTLFVAYLVAIGLMPDIRRVFAYHGAEHKTINAYEHGVPLEPEAVARFPRAHTRCGTGFLLLVLVIFVLLATLLGRPPLLLRVASRLVLVPVVAGIAYEAMKAGARAYERSALVRLLMAPGLALQSLTTREPEPAMLEVSIRALREILDSQGLVVESAGEAQVDPVPAASTLEAES